MPQLDKYIFLNQILALSFFFFITYVYIRSIVIPNINMSLKFRYKRFEKLFSHERGNWGLLKETNASFGRRAVTQLNSINQNLNSILTKYKYKYNLYFIWLVNTYFLSKYLFFLLKIINIKNKGLYEFIHKNFWFYKKSKQTSSYLISTFNNKNFYFFSQEYFNYFFIKEIIRSNNFL